MTDLTRDILNACLAAISTAVCLAIVVSSRIYRIVPFFTIYLVATVIETVAGIIVFHRAVYSDVYLWVSLSDYLFDSLVIFELSALTLGHATTWIYRPLRGTGIGLIATGILTSLLFTISADFHHVEPFVRTLISWDLGFDVFRVLLFSLVLTVSIVLGVRWTHIQIKIAACFSLYSALALIGRALQEYADRLPTFRAWFTIIDSGSVFSWTVIMGILSWHLAGQQLQAAPKICKSPSTKKPNHATQKAGVMR